MGNDHPRDELVVGQVLDGNREAFRVLVERYQLRVFSVSLRLVGNRAEAEDLTQQAFVEAFGSLARYDRGRSFATWLLRIAVNNCKDHLKSHKRRECQLGEEADTARALFAGRVPDPEQAAARNERASLVVAALSRLDRKYRVPLVLKDIEGLSYQEMQGILDLPLTTLKIRVVRARVQLQECLQCLIAKS